MCRTQRTRVKCDGTRLEGAPTTRLSASELGRMTTHSETRSDMTAAKRSKAKRAAQSQSQKHAWFVSGVVCKMCLIMLTGIDSRRKIYRRQNETHHIRNSSVIIPYVANVHVPQMRMLNACAIPPKMPAEQLSETRIAIASVMQIV